MTSPRAAHVLGRHPKIVSISGGGAPIVFSAPIITSIFPNAGPATGGTSVTIFGAGFTGATGVRFGGVAATGVTVISDSAISCDTPAHVQGAVTVTVTTPAGTGSLSGGFTYNAPQVLSISPATGLTTGGTAVTIVGATFTGATSATVGGVPLTSFLVVDDNHITGVTGAHSSGIVDVDVIAPSGTGVGSSLFTYQAFDPAQLNFSAWWRADYSGAPWPGSTSIGTSDTHPATSAGNPATVAPALNGRLPARFDGVANELQAALAAWDVTASFSMALLVYIESASATTFTPAADANVITGTSGAQGVSVATNGITAYLHDTVTGTNTLTFAMGTGSWHLLQWTWDGATMRGRLDNGSWSTVASAVSAAPTTWRLGANYNETAFANVRIAEFMIGPGVISDTNYDNIRAYCTSRYGVTV